MTIRRSIVASLIALAAAACGGSSTPAPATPIANTPSPATATVAARPTVLGKWREYWGTPGETDVTYHDEYEVGDKDGQPYVVPLAQDHPDVINTVTIKGDDLDLVIQTAFEVHYQLHLDAGGATMSGTATTPDKTVPIRWERITD